MKVLLTLFVLLALVLCIGYAIAVGYRQPWTGFAGYVDGKGEMKAPKRLWDWLDLLVVPFILAIAVWFLDGSRKASERCVELDRQRQKTLDDYFKFMTEMLLNDPPLDGESSEAARSVVRIRTLSALRTLDGGRKAQLLQFLYESGLIGKDPVVRLTGADLAGADLDNAVLCRAELRGVDFRAASLRNARLEQADLRGSNFSNANLTAASLASSDLTQAVLTNAKLRRAELQGAITVEAVMPRVRWPFRSS